MIKIDNYIDKFKERRDFFQKLFPMKIGRQRVGVKSKDVLKNTCPVCGYFTIDERNSFDICSICFWEDDGIDDFEENEESGPNQMTLKEGREIFQEAKIKLVSTNHHDSSLINELKNKLLTLDNLIEQNITDKSEILRQQTEIVDILTKNKVYGLDKLFEK